MPYVSKAERERAGWMTLREALDHIQMTGDCNLRAAWDHAIGDQEARVRWADASLDLSTIGDGSYVDEDNVPPTAEGFWKSARAIFTGEGSVLDDPACRSQSVRIKLIREGKLGYRRLLVLREHVEKNWPGDSAEHLSSGESTSATKDIIRAGRPSARNLVWQTLDRMLARGDQLGVSQKRLAESIAQENDKKLGRDRGWNERTIVSHVSDWLKADGLTTGDAKKPK